MVNQLALYPLAPNLPLKVRSAMDAGPLLPNQALELKLIDGVIYKDEVINNFCIPPTSSKSWMLCIV